MFRVANDTAHYQCLSSDARPTTGIGDGATLHILDTGQSLVYHNGMWVIDLRLTRAMKLIPFVGS